MCHIESTEWRNSLPLFSVKRNGIAHAAKGHVFPGYPGQGVTSSSYTEIYSVMYDSGSVPEQSIFSPRETSNPESLTNNNAAKDPFPVHTSSLEPSEWTSDFPNAFSVGISFDASCGGGLKWYLARKSQPPRISTGPWV